MRHFFLQFSYHRKKVKLRYSDKIFGNYIQNLEKNYQVHFRKYVLEIYSWLSVKNMHPLITSSAKPLSHRFQQLKKRSTSNGLNFRMAHISASKNIGFTTNRVHHLPASRSNLTTHLFNQHTNDEHIFNHLFNINTHKGTQLKIDTHEREVTSYVIHNFETTHQVNVLTLQKRII